jgi:hypothetical protein
LRRSVIGGRLLVNSRYRGLGGSRRGGPFGYCQKNNNYHKNNGNGDNRQFVFF